MSDYTKNGLLILMVSLIISIISSIIIALLINNLISSFATENFTSEEIISNIIVIVPASIVTIIAGILFLVAGILILLGRKEFGEKHHKFIKYAIYIFIIYIVVIITFGVTSQIISYTSNNPYSFFQTKDSTSVLNSFNNVLVINSTSNIIGAIIGGLIAVFGLYQLENRKGKNFLFLGYGSSITFSVINSLYLFIFFDDIISSDIFQQLIGSESTSSAYFSSFINLFQGIGDLLIIGIIGTTFTNIFYIIAIYIPYKRIKTGELKPALPIHLKRCNNCGKATPADSIVCAYCGNRFNGF